MNSISIQSFLNKGEKIVKKSHKAATDCFPHFSLSRSSNIRNIIINYCEMNEKKNR
jgi:hypothetical protein